MTAAARVCSTHAIYMLQIDHIDHSITNKKSVHTKLAPRMIKIKVKINVTYKVDIKVNPTVKLEAKAKMKAKLKVKVKIKMI